MMLRSKWKRTLLGCSLLTAGGLLPLTTIAAPAAQPQAAQLGKAKSRAATAAQAAQTARVQPPVTQLIVKFKPAADARAAAVGDAYAMTDRRLANISAAAGMALAYRRPMSGNAHVLKLAQPLSAAEAAALAAKVSQQADVAYAQPDYWMFPAAAPSETDYNLQWHYHDPVASGKAGAANLPAAWDITTGSSDVVVAVIDTGVLNHADLQDNLIGGSAATSGYDMISYASAANSGDALSNDGDGRDGDPTDPGDWVRADEPNCNVGGSQTTSSWHGTHVAGTIGAVANNGIGGSGVAWQVGLQTVRALGSCGGLTSDITEAIYWAAGVRGPDTPAEIPENPNPAHVINMSLGGKAPCSDTPAYQEAINAAVARGVTVVVAAGNEADEVKNYTPASCSNVITIGALSPDGGEAYYSNYDYLGIP